MPRTAKTVALPTPAAEAPAAVLVPLADLHLSPLNPR